MGAHQIARMSGREFELFVRDKLEAQGYKEIDITPASRDMGADLIIRQQGRKIVVQCKRCAGVVGVKAVQEVLGAKSYYRAAEAWVITDSTFTRAAQSLAKKARVRLRMLRFRQRG
jgi:restriction system protein